MHLLLVSVIALLLVAVFMLGFFWLFRSENLRRVAYTKAQSKFYRWDDSQARSTRRQVNAAEHASLRE